MKLKLERLFSNKEETIGKLYIDGVYECITLEDQFNPKKIWGETRIPSGTYKITSRGVGRIKEMLCKLFPAVVKYSLWIRNIPEFEYVLIHTGNNDKHTAGCLLVGTKFSESNGRYTIQNSQVAYLALHKKVSSALDSGKEVWIEIIDEPIDNNENYKLN